MNDKNFNLIISVIALSALITAYADELILKQQNFDLKTQVSDLKSQLEKQPTSEQIDKQCSMWLMNSDLLKARDRVCAGVVQRLNNKGK